MNFNSSSSPSDFNVVHTGDPIPYKKEGTTQEEKKIEQLEEKQETTAKISEVLERLLHINTEVLEFLEEHSYVPDLENYRNVFALANISLEGVGYARSFGILLAQTMIIQKVKKELANPAIDSKEKKKIEHWVHVREKSINKKWKKLGVESSGFAILRTMEILPIFVKLDPKILDIFSLASFGVRIGLLSYELHESSKELKAQKKHVRNRLIGMTSQIKSNDQVEKEIDSLIKQRRETVAERRHSSNQEFEDAYQPFMSWNEMAFESKVDIKEELTRWEKSGIFINEVFKEINQIKIKESLTTVEEYNNVFTFIKENPEAAKPILRKSFTGSDQEFKECFLEFFNYPYLPQGVEEVNTEIGKWNKKGLDLHTIFRFRQEHGVKQEVSIQTVEDYKNTITYIKENEEGKEIIRDAFIHHKETKRILVKNALKTLAVQKHTQERKFLRFNHNTIKAKLAVFVTGAGLFTILKALAIVGLVSGLAASGIGAGAFAITFLIGGLGLWYFYHKKPATFKAYTQGTFLQKKFYDWMVQKNLRKEKKLINKMTIEKEKNPALVDLENSKYYVKYQKLQEKTKVYQKKQQKALQKIGKAGWKDFTRKLPTYTDEAKHNLVEALKEQLGDMQDDILSFLEEEMEIQPHDKSSLSQGIDNFCGLGEKELMQIIYNNQTTPIKT